ncbi:MULTISPECIES: hypothetical protein [Sphingomonas]|uniref:Uncharacterized protein n=1 Tax=Sphingomonas molluscorum TaxID=418184 RepID=A0ABU8Q7I3_9SPHN|nr:hypothetical protein [Sphingomonas sp. JUb134]MBM7407053.1 hypothetical protein [Sphingomonas sp. JUb134]
MAARSSARRDLFLQVSGSVDPLKAILKSGSSALVEFKGDAEKQLDAVEKALREIGSAGAGDGAKQMTQSYNAAFREIRRNAEQVAGAGNGSDALLIVNAKAARDAALAAEQRAAAVRVVAEAARAEAVAQGGTNAVLVQYAAAAMAAEKETTDYAIALRNQANTLTAVEGRMGALVPAGENITKMSGQARAGMQQLSYQLGDVATQWSMNTPLAVIFAQQIGQVTQAIGLMAGESKGLIGFLGGPWGMAIASALVVLTPLVSKLLEGGDALKNEVEQLKENAAASALADEAKKVFAKTEAGIIDDVRKLTEEVDRQNDSLRTNAERLNARANKDLDALRDKRAPAAEKVAAAQANLEAAKRGGPGQGLATLSYAQAQYDRFRAELDKIDRGIAAAERALAKSRAGLAVEQSAADVKALASPQNRLDRDFADAKEKLQLEYTQKIVAAKTDLNKQQALTNELTRKQLALQTKYDADTAAERKRQSAARAASSGSLTPAEVGKMLQEQFGGTVTSTTGGKHTKNSFHYRGQALDWVPRGGMGAVSKQEIRSFLEAQGVDIKELLGPGDKDHNDHFHVAFSKTQRGQDAIDQDRIRKEQAEASRQQAYANQLRSAQDDFYQAQVALAAGAEQRVEIQIEQLQAAKVQRDQAIDAQVKAGKLEVAEAEKLKTLNAQTLLAREIVAYREDEKRKEKKRQDLLDQALEASRAEQDRQRSLLDLQGQFATTLAERRRIATEMLEIELQQRRDAARRKTASTDLQTRVDGARDLEQIDAEEPLLRDQLDRDFAGPLDQYRAHLKETTDDMSTALEGVAVRGFGALEDAGSREIANLLKMKGAYGEFASSVIADLARIAIQKAIVGTIGGGFFGLKTGGKIQKRAGGGKISGPGTGTSDSIFALIDGRDPLLVSNGESVVTAEATRRYWPIIDAMNKGRIPGLATGGMIGSSVPRMADFSSVTPQSVTRPTGPGRMQLDANVTVKAGPEFDARMESVSLRTVAATAEPIMAGAEARTRRRLARPDLPGGFGG